MKQRQSREREILKSTRLLQPGEIDHLIDRRNLFTAPEPLWTEEVLLRCEAIFERMPSGRHIPDGWFCDLDKWVFLEYALRFRRVLLFGSNQPDQAQLSPVKLSDNLEGWNRMRYFAFATSTEAIYHAILDRARLDLLDCPVSCSISLPFGGVDDTVRRFYIGLDYRALPEGVWCPGTVYLYRADEFPDDYIDRPFWTDKPIRPIAHLDVKPTDWPMLGHVSGVDQVSQAKRQWDTYDGFPWRLDNDIHPHLWKRPLAEEVREYLDTEFATPIGLKELGKRVGASSFGVLRMFQAEFGVSPNEYLSNLRIRHAKHLLRQGLPIAEVAADCGFCDQTHLNRHFRQRVDLTPGQYLRAQDHPIPAA